MIVKSTNGTSLAKSVAPAPRILPDMAQEMAEMRAEMARIREENEALRRAKAGGAVSIKFGEDKGNMIISGFGRYPFTFYRSQWEKFRANLPTIDAWFEANKHRMATKD